MASSRGAFLLSVVLGASACTTGDVGFGVALSLDSDDHVTDDLLARITQLTFSASGDEHGIYTKQVGHPFMRHERVVYRPLTTTSTLLLTITALDTNDVPIASGSTPKLTLTPGETTHTSVLLDAARTAADLGTDDLTPPDDMGTQDGGIDLLPSPPDLVTFDAGLAPGAPSALELVEQTANAAELTWSAPTVGGAPIAQYNIYRNGTAVGKSTTTTYHDNTATNTANGAFTGPATVYAYKVTAVDSVGREGPKTSQTISRIYNNGSYAWGDDYSFGVNLNYTDTNGAPAMGSADLSMAVTGQFGGWSPVAGGPFTVWDFESGAFDHLSVDLKPTMANQTWSLLMNSRMPDGHGYQSLQIDFTMYGPTPTVGKWGTYNVPLSAINYGTSMFTASITGTTMTVTKAISGVSISTGGFITGTGVAAGTWITAASGNGGVGTYTVTPSQNVGSTTITELRNAVWFLSLQDGTGVDTNLFYIDDVKFTGP